MEKAESIKVKTLEKIGKKTEIDNQIRLDNAEITYNEYIRLYNIENESYNTLKQSTGNLLLINGTILSFITIAVVELFKLYIDQKVSFLIVLFVIPYLSIICSIYYALKTYLREGPKTLNIDSVHLGSLENKSKMFLLSLSNSLRDITRENSKNNNKTKIYVNRSVYALIFEIISFTILIILIILRVI